MGKKLNNLTVLIIAKNETPRLRDCIESAGFAGTVTVLDNGSADDTGKVASACGAKVIVYKSADFSDLRNRLIREARTEWVMYLDADERITPELALEIGKTITKYRPGSSPEAYFIRRKNYYLGMHPWPVTDKVERLFLLKSLKKWTGRVHESPVYEGLPGILEYPLIHITHRNLEEMVQKTNNWSDVEARLRLEANHPPVSWWRIIRVMITGFTGSYFTQQGWRAGTVGFIESMYQAYSMFVTYAKLWELQQKKF